jgi:ribosomal protein L3
VGDVIELSLFEVGELIDVFEWTKGKRFQGVMKRDDFAMGLRPMD